MMDEPLVTVIVLNYNGKEHLEYCLPSIKQTEYNNFQVIVVDNNSSDNSVKYVREKHPWCEILELDENVGWAGGNNAGINYARKQGAKYVVLANNDIRVHPQWINGAVKAAGSDTDIGFVGFDIYGTIKPVPVKKYEDACKEWSELEYEPTTDFIDGMALFMPISVFDDIGMIDEQYFLYGEETDLEIRGNKAGYKRIKTNIPIWHYSSGTTKDMPIKSAYLAIRNHIRLAIKHESLVGICRRILLLYYIGCYPLYNGDLKNRFNARRRPRGIIFNFLLITYCIVWNLFHLPATLRRRKKENSRIKEIKNR